MVRAVEVAIWNHVSGAYAAHDERQKRKIRVRESMLNDDCGKMLMQRYIGARFGPKAIRAASARQTGFRGCEQSIPTSPATVIQLSEEL